MKTSILLPLDVWSKQFEKANATNSIKAHGGSKKVPQVPTVQLDDKLFFSLKVSGYGLAASFLGYVVSPVNTYNGDVFQCYADCKDNPSLTGLLVTAKGGLKMVVSDTVEIIPALPQQSCGLSFDRAIDWCMNPNNFKHWGHRKWKIPTLTKFGPFAIMLMGKEKYLVWRHGKDIKTSIIPNEFPLCLPE